MTYVSTFHDVTGLEVGPHNELFSGVEVFGFEYHGPEGSSLRVREFVSQASMHRPEADHVHINVLFDEDDTVSVGPERLGDGYRIDLGPEVVVTLTIEQSEQLWVQLDQLRWDRYITENGVDLSVEPF